MTEDDKERLNALRKKVAAMSVECELIQKVLESPIEDDPNMLTERGARLSTQIARTGKMLAEAKCMYNVAREIQLLERIGEFTDSRLSAKVQNAILDGLAYREKYIVDYIDRLNAASVHQLDFIRTLLSKAKAEMQYLNFQK